MTPWTEVSTVGGRSGKGPSSGPLPQVYERLQNEQRKSKLFTNLIFTKGEKVWFLSIEVVGLDWTGFNELNVVICQFFCLSNKHFFSLVFALQQRETASV
jgi:hypothetical protein